MVTTKIFRGFAPPVMGAVSKASHPALDTESHKNRTLIINVLHVKPAMTNARKGAFETAPIHAG
jgi:hypothetical protein